MANCFEILPKGGYYVLGDQGPYTPATVPCDFVMYTASEYENVSTFVNAPASANTLFVETLDTLLVAFDAEYFEFITGWTLMGLTIGVTAGWMYKAIKSR